MQRRHFVRSLATLPFGASALAAAAPMDSDKPIQIIVPFGPGGSGDITARMLAEFMTKKTGRPVVVDNRPGANGIIGVEAVRKAPADGSVLLLATTSTHAANPNLFKKLPYDPERDFRLVGHFGASSTFMLVKPDAPYKTLADFVETAKAAPGQINYGYFNASSQVPGALLGRLAGIELSPIPYKQVNTAMTELIAGQIQVVFTDSVAGDSFVSSGLLRALAAHGEKRLARYPTVPLITESYPAYDITGFLGVAAPAGTPAATQQALNDLINEAVTTNPMKAKLEGFGFSPRRMSLDDLAKFGREERVKWKSYVALARIAPQ